MNLQFMAQVADLIGAIAITVSLVYLAIQMRQTRSLRAENYAHALDRVAEMQARLRTNPELVRIFNAGLAGPLALRRSGRVQFAPTRFSASFAAFVESRICAPMRYAERTRLWAEFLSAPTP